MSIFDPLKEDKVYIRSLTDESPYREAHFLALIQTTEEKQ